MVPPPRAGLEKGFLLTSKESAKVLVAHSDLKSAAVAFNSRAASAFLSRRFTRKPRTAKGKSSEGAATNEGGRVRQERSKGQRRGTKEKEGGGKQLRRAKEDNYPAAT